MPDVQTIANAAWLPVNYMSITSALSDSVQKELPCRSLFPFNRKKPKSSYPPALSFCALSFSGGIPSPLITRERNQLGANGPFSFCQIHRISLTTSPPSLPCGIMLLAPLTLLSHYPWSPCVNIYHSNINCSSFQLLSISFKSIFRSYISHTPPPPVPVHVASRSLIWLRS